MYTIVDTNGDPTKLNPTQLIVMFTLLIKRTHFSVNMKLG